MTYNIRVYGEADDIVDAFFGNYEGWGGRTPSNALATIVELQPDVVGLQEDNNKLYAEYSKVSGLSDYTRITDKGNGDEGNEILYNSKAGVTLVKKNGRNQTGIVYFKDLANTYADESAVLAADFSKDTKGDNSKGRFFRWAILEKDGVQYLVVNTHLHYRASGTSESSDAINKNLRKAQATLLRLWLVSMLDECPNQIVMGDMNSQQDAKEFAGFTLGTGALTEARDAALVKGDVGGTLVIGDFTTREKYIYDHVLYTADSLKAVEYSVIDNDDPGASTLYPSDHLPVYSKFVCYN